MGLGSSKPKATYLNMKIKGDAPEFFCKETGQADGKFYGDLRSIRVQEPNEKANFASLKMEFYDDKMDRYVISGSLSNIATSIINTFAKGVDDKNEFNNLCLSLYAKDGFSRIGIFQDGTMMGWKYEMSELNKMTEKKRVNGKDVTDREELDAYLRKEIDKISNYLKELYGDEAPAAGVDEEEDFFPEEESSKDKTPGEKLRDKAKKNDGDNDELPF